MRFFGIFGPNNVMIDAALRTSRKEARQDFAKDAGTNWGHLWELGYRCREVPVSREGLRFVLPDEFMKKIPEIYGIDS